MDAGPATAIDLAGLALAVGAWRGMPAWIRLSERFSRPRTSGGEILLWPFRAGVGIVALVCIVDLVRNVARLG